jgi:hypothetical protein
MTCIQRKVELGHVSFLSYNLIKIIYKDGAPEHQQNVSRDKPKRHY